MRRLIVLFVLALASGCAPQLQPTYPPPRVEASVPSAPKAPDWCGPTLASAPRPIAIASLFGKVRGVVKPKGEYETTEAFQDRAKAALATITATLDGASGGGRIAVLVPLLALYDADQRTYRISTPTETLFFGDIVFEGGFMRYPHDFLFVPVASSSKGTGSYIGANAFGVMTTVQATHNEDYGVALVDQKRNGDGWNRQRGDLLIPMSPDRAATLKGKLGVMIIGDLVPPGTIEGSLHASPTLSAPTDLTVRQRYVTMTSPCAAIVTTDTREVLRLLTR